MATYKIRGTSHNVIYPYRTEDGTKKQQWESYDTELEAVQRKAYIDFLQKNNRLDEVRAAAVDYKEKHTPAKMALAAAPAVDSTQPTASEDNTHRTYAEFIDRFCRSTHGKCVFPPIHTTAMPGI